MNVSRYFSRVMYTKLLLFYKILGFKLLYGITQIILIAFQMSYKATGPISTNNGYLIDKHYS